MTRNNNPPGDARSGQSHCLPFPAHPNDTPAGQPLALRHVRQLTNAEAFSASLGQPLTAHVTLHLRLVEGFHEEAWAEFQSALLDRASRWLKRQGLPVAFAWVRESGSKKGPHLHLLIHLPHQHWGAFHRFLSFTGRFQASDESGEAIVITGGSWGMYVPTMRSGVLRYLLKSLEASASTVAALGLRQQPTRPVPLKRCGVSTTLAQKARREAGWVELRSIPELHAHLHPANDNATEALHAVA